MSSAGRVLAFVLVSGSMIVGGYGVYASRQARARAADVEHDRDLAKADLADCKNALDASRTQFDEFAADATASLSASRTELDALRTERAEADKRLASFKALTEKFRKMIDSGKLQVVLKHGRMVVKLPAGILFASGSADLSKEGQAALVEVATILKGVHDRRFMVAGHTDNVPVVQPSPFKNNLELSTARALKVAGALVGAGMNASRLVAAGYAEFEPVRENSTEAGRQENRRIEIVLLPNIAELPPMPGEIADAGAHDAGARDAGDAGAR